MTGASSRRPRVLALDPGRRRTGLAGTDPSGSMAFPLGTLDSSPPGKLMDGLAGLVKEREVEVIVVGVPLAADGGEGKEARRCRALAEQIRARFPGIEVAVVDEALTTGEAHDRLKEGGMRAARRRTRADAVAALVILQRYLAMY